MYYREVLIRTAFIQKHLPHRTEHVSKLVKLLDLQQTNSLNYNDKG